MIETERLLIRPWAQDDLAFLFSMATDIGYNCFAPPGVFLLESESQARSKIQERILKYETTGLGKFPVFLRSTGEFLGTCGIDPYPIHENEEVELGYRFLLRHWGCGYATEAAKAIVQYAFHQLHREKVYAFALRQNRASIRLIEQLEFLPDGQISHKGLVHDLYVKSRH